MHGWVRTVSAGECRNSLYFVSDHVCPVMHTCITRGRWPASNESRFDKSLSSSFDPFFATHAQRVPFFFFFLCAPRSTPL